VDPDLVPAFVNFTYKVRDAFHIPADQKKRGADTMVRKHIQHTRRIARMRTVVEGQRDRSARFVPMPKRGWVAFLHRTVKLEQGPGDQSSNFTRNYSRM
jgi:hypothetical protein